MQLMPTTCAPGGQCAADERDAQWRAPLSTPSCVRVRCRSIAAARSTAVFARRHVLKGLAVRLLP